MGIISRDARSLDNGSYVENPFSPCGAAVHTQQRLVFVKETSWFRV